MTIYFPSDLTIKHVLAGDESALRYAIEGKAYQELNFAHKKLEGSAAVRIVKALKNLRVPSLNFSANWVNTPYLAEFMQRVSELDTLRLNLANNWITDKGAEVIAKYISPTQLKSLNISFNQIGKEGCNALYHACMARNIDLDLQHNYRFS